MDFAFTTEQQHIKKAARQFAKGEFPINNIARVGSIIDPTTAE